MSHSIKRPIRRFIFSRYMVAGAISLIAIPGSICAQAEKADLLEEVVVTGTLIRGVQRTGSQTIGINADDVIETGAVTTNELFATVPQVSNFI